ncbi:MAG: recombinase family protein [Nitrosomonas sp.]|nr:recombinase family protein [Nitrosomonas sp.]
MLGTKAIIAQVLQDEGVSGGLIDRPGIKALLAFLKQNRNQAYVVIIDDISRLARGLEAHIQLRTAISGAGGKLENPSIEFGEDSDSQLVENLLVSVSQHQRQKNGEQVKKTGCWCVPNLWPLSYKPRWRDLLRGVLKRNPSQTLSRLPGCVSKRAGRPCSLPARP